MTPWIILVVSCKFKNNIYIASNYFDLLDKMEYLLIYLNILPVKNVG